MPKYTGYKMAFEDWDVDRFQKKNKEMLNCYLTLNAEPGLSGRFFNHQRLIMFHIQFAVHIQPISQQMLLEVKV